MIKKINKPKQEGYTKKFNRTLINFCNKCPLDLEITNLDTKIIFIWTDAEQNFKKFEYNIDFTLDVKSNIKNIKDHLLMYYPVFSDKIEKKYSTKEISKQIDELISKGMKVSEATEQVLSSSTYYESSPRYKLVRRIDQSNEINVYDMKDRVTYIYTLKIPISMFIKYIYSDFKKAEDIFNNDEITIFGGRIK